MVCPCDCEHGLPRQVEPWLLWGQGALQDDPGQVSSSLTTCWSYIYHLLGVRLERGWTSKPIFHQLLGLQVEPFLQLPTWNNTLQSLRYPSDILEISWFSHFLFLFCLSNHMHLSYSINSPFAKNYSYNMFSAFFNCCCCCCCPCPCREREKWGFMKSIRHRPAHFGMLLKISFFLSKDSFG